MRTLYWLASYPKSGNTWVRMLLQAYTWGDSLINKNSEIVASDIARYPYQVVSPEPLTELNPGAVMYLRYAALMHISARHPHDPPIVKTHNANICVNGAVNLIPRELTNKAVYLVRDPRDLIISYSEHVGEDLNKCIENLDNMNHALHQEQVNVYHHLTTWSNHVEGWMGAEFPVLVVKYEALLQDTEYWFTEILKQFDIEPDQERVRKAVELTKFEKLKSQEKNEGFIEASKHTKFFKRGKSGYWRDILNRTQAARIERDHSKMMQKLGYQSHYIQAA